MERDSLLRDALARGMALESVCAMAPPGSDCFQRGKGHARASQEEFRAFLDALASKAPNVPQLRTETFSREMIYGEHA